MLEILPYIIAYICGLVGLFGFLLAFIIFYLDDYINNYSSPLDKANIKVLINEANSQEPLFVASRRLQVFKFVHDSPEFRGENYTNLLIKAYFTGHGESGIWGLSGWKDKFIEKWNAGDEITFTTDYVGPIKEIILNINGDVYEGKIWVRKFKFEKKLHYKKPFDKP